MSPLMKGQASYYVGDLIFSRTGCSGIVLYVFPDPSDSSKEASYMMLWTIGTPHGYRIKEQFRDGESIRRK